MEKERRKNAYFVNVFDRPPVDFGGLEDIEDTKAIEKLEKEHLKKYPFPGEILKFDKKLDLDQWMDRNGVINHKSDYLAGRCLLQLEDGRTVAIYHGEQKILKIKRSVR